MKLLHFYILCMVITYGYCWTATCIDKNGKHMNSGSTHSCCRSSRGSVTNDGNCYKLTPETNMKYNQCCFDKGYYGSVFW